MAAPLKQLLCFLAGAVLELFLGPLGLLQF